MKVRNTAQVLTYFFSSLFSFVSYTTERVKHCGKASKRFKQQVRSTHQEGKKRAFYTYETAKQQKKGKKKCKYDEVMITVSIDQRGMGWT